MNGFEKLCLNWNDFKDNVTTAFGSLRTDTDFSDVTLACEDGKQFEAHKVILASTSPFFLDILKRNKHPHPLIYMRGLKSGDLAVMLDFLYFGEANIFQENLNDFLALAEELKLKGLTGNSENKDASNFTHIEEENILPPKEEDLHNRGDNTKKKLDANPVKKKLSPSIILCLQI